MKKILKKISCILIAAAMMISITATTASADDTFTNNETNVFYYAKNGSNYDSILVGGLSSKATIKKSSVKTSNSKVVSPTRLERYIGKSKTQYISSNSSDYGYTSYSYTIGVLINGTGSAKITFKMGGKTYTAKYKVYAYTNPLKTLTIKGVNGGKNIASVFASTNSASGKNLSSTQKDAAISVAAKSGWKITSVSYSSSSSSNNSLYYSASSNAGVSKVTLRPDKLTKGVSQYVTINLKNTKTGGTVYCHYNFS